MSKKGTSFQTMNDAGTIIRPVAAALTGNVTGDVTGDVTGQTFGTVSSYTTATPAIALTDKVAVLDATSNGVAATLAAGTAGQVIYVKATVVSGGATTLTPATFTDGTTVTFTPANEHITLVSDGTNWLSVGGTAAIT